MPPAPDTPRPTSSWSGARRPFPPAIRRRILRRANGLCQLQYDGCRGRATEADHIVGHADALALGWDLEQIDAEDNGQAVCSSCHQVKTRAEQQRGRRRAAAARPRQRPTPPHPGLVA